MVELLFTLMTWLAYAAFFGTLAIFGFVAISLLFSGVKDIVSDVSWSIWVRRANKKS